MIQFASRLAAAAVGLALFAAAQPAFAQDAERDFCADRPGKGAPTCILDVGRVQLEGGFGWSHDDHAGVEADEYDYGALTLRFGLTDALEGQVLWSPHVVARERIGGVTFEESGASDLGVSLRQSILSPDGSGTSIAVQAIVTAPTGSNGISADVWEGSLLLPMSFEIGEDTALTFMPEVDIVGDAGGGGHHAAFAAAIGVEHGMGQFEVAAELWARRDDDPIGATTQASLGLMLMWQPEALDDVQFDVGVDIGLNNDTPDLEFGVGVAKRF